MSFLARGRIVWVTVPDPRGGNPRRRPAVVVTPTAQIDPAGTVEVAAVTTQLGQARSSETVELPSHPAGHPDTNLKKPCEVVCSWVLSVAVSDVSDGGGFVPTDVLAEILVKVSRLS